MNRRGQRIPNGARIFIAAAVLMLGVVAVALLAGFATPKPAPAPAPSPTATATPKPTTTPPPPDTLSISLEPDSDSSRVAVEHTVMATVTSLTGGGEPPAGVAVQIEISDGPNSPDLEVGVTDDLGRFPFTYIGDGGGGRDTIIVCISDLDEGGCVNVGTEAEPRFVSAEATISWFQLKGAPPPTPRAQNRDLIIEHTKDPIKVGEQATITVTVVGQDVTVLQSALTGQIQWVVTTQGKPLLIYFSPFSPTDLTLKVSALNFVIDYSPAETQEIFLQTSKVEWTVTMSPRSGASGRQDVAVTLTQSLPGEQLPRDAQPTYDIIKFSIFVTTPGQPFYDRILPGGLPSLIGAIAGLITAITGAFVVRTAMKNRSPRS